MPKDPKQRYAESLEKTLQPNSDQLKERVEDFKALCMMVTPERQPPQEVITNIPKLYKEIQERLSEIRAIQQVLQGKYRQYYRRDSLREKSIVKIGFLTKTLYSKFEYLLLQKPVLARKKDEETDPSGRKTFPSLWFRSKDRHVAFIRNLRILGELNDEDPSDQGLEERRTVLPEKVRHLTLFTFKGEPELLRRIYSCPKLREDDILELYAPDELRGLLVHLLEVDPPELEGIFKRKLESLGAVGLKGLLIRVHSQGISKRTDSRGSRSPLKRLRKGESLRCHDFPHPMRFSGIVLSKALFFIFDTFGSTRYKKGGSRRSQTRIHPHPF